MTKSRLFGDSDLFAKLSVLDNLDKRQRKPRNVLFSRPLTCHITNHGYNEVLAEERMMFMTKKKKDSLIRQKLPKELLKNCDIFVGGRQMTSIAFRNGLSGYFSKKIKMILLDIEWGLNYFDASKAWNWKAMARRKLGKIYRRVVAGGVDFIQVFSKSDRDNYAEFYGIDPNKFAFIPYCSNVDETTYNTKPGDYVFSGGNNDRNYSSFFEAIRDIDIKVRIAADKELFVNMAVPSNVEILGRLPWDDFSSHMAGAKFVVLPITSKSLRATGIVTYVEAMRMGKAIIVSEENGTRSYFKNREHGLIIPPNDSKVLQEAIFELLDDSNLLNTLETNALAHAKANLGYDRYFSDLDRLIEKVCTAQ